MHIDAHNEQIFIAVSLSRHIMQPSLPLPPYRLMEDRATTTRLWQTATEEDALRGWCCFKICGRLCMAIPFDLVWADMSWGLSLYVCWQYCAFHKGNVDQWLMKMNGS